MTERAVTSSGRPQKPSRFGEGTREVSKAKEGNKGHSGPSSPPGGMKISTPNHPDKSKVR